MSAFPAKFLMAPMAGVTDEPFRERLRRNGARAIWTEMVSAAALVRRHKNSLRMASPGDLDDSTVIQIFGARPGELRDAAMLLADRGWSRIDLNLGCPVKKVVKSGAGAALMRTPILAGDCVGAVRGGFPGIVTVKMRLGWSSEEKNFPEIARIAESEGADGVILHGRTRAQGYSGVADWDAIELLAGTLSIPVAGNGDISSAREAFRRLSSPGLGAVMIGRAALGSPWIFRDADLIASGLAPLGPPGRDEVVEDLLTHLGRLVELKGPGVAVAEMKKFAAWSDKGVEGAAERRNRIMRASTVVEMENGLQLIGCRAIPA